MENKFKKSGELLMRFLLEVSKTKGLSTTYIADKSGFDQPHVWRMLNAKYLPNLENFLKLTYAIGVRIELHSDSEAPENVSVRNSDTPRFLFAPDYKADELYILHTHMPACLIKVIQKMPIELQIVENYEQINSDTTDLINDAHDFFITFSTLQS
jgi:DNA-binding phage protein